MQILTKILLTILLLGSTCYGSEVIVIGQPLTPYDPCTEFAVQDTFTDDDGTELTTHTPDCGTSWVENSAEAGGENQITNNRVHPTTTNNSYSGYLASDTPSDANYTVSADAYVVADPSSPRSDVGLLVRSATDARTYYRCRLLGSNVCDIVECNAGSCATLDSESTCIAGGIQTSTTYTLQCVISSSLITMKVNGTTKCEITDSTITAAGKAGIWTFNGTSSTGIHIDNFQLVD